MERDLITRVFLSSGGTPYVREVYPKHAGFDEKDKTKGPEAEATLARKDYVGVYMSLPRDHFVGYGFQDKATSTDFRISDKDIKVGVLSDEAWAKIAKIIEKRAGKKGLTIVIY